MACPESSGQSLDRQRHNAPPQRSVSFQPVTSLNSNANATSPMERSFSMSSLRKRWQTFCQKLTLKRRRQSSTEEDASVPGASFQSSSSDCFEVVGIEEGQLAVSDDDDASLAEEAVLVDLQGSSSLEERIREVNLELASPVRSLEAEGTAEVNDWDETVVSAEPVTAQLSQISYAVAAAESSEQIGTSDDVPIETTEPTGEAAESCELAPVSDLATCATDNTTESAVAALSNIPCSVDPVELVSVQSEGLASVQSIEAISVKSTELVHSQLSEPVCVQPAEVASVQCEKPAREEPDNVQPVSSVQSEQDAIQSEQVNVRSDPLNNQSAAPVRLQPAEPVCDEPTHTVGRQSAEAASTPSVGQVRDQPAGTPVCNEPTKRASDTNPYLCFPFLTDPQTIRFVSQNPVMLVMRGLPGSGKSTIVQAVQRVYPNTETFSADHYFMVNGQYRFNSKQLKQAHEDCQRKTRAACEQGTKMIVVDNTNVIAWEMTPYSRAANQHGYRQIVVEPKTPWRLDPHKLAKKNTHGVPKASLAKKAESFEPAPPLYYAWFLDRAGSQDLLGQSTELLQYCLKNCSAFFEDFKQFSGLRDLAAMLGYFDRNQCLDSNRDIVHCTAKFCGRNGGKDYAARQEVIDSLGHVSDLSVLGYVVTRDTFGARIHLTEDQLRLYGQNDDENLANKPQPPSSATSTNSKKPAKTTASGDSKDRNSKKAAKLDKHMMSSSEDRFYPLPGRGRRAHITLGTAGGAKPVTTGFDLLQAVREERVANKSGRAVPTFALGKDKSGLVLRQYEEGLWVVYPAEGEEAKQFPAMFTGHY